MAKRAAKREPRCGQNAEGAQKARTEDPNGESTLVEAVVLTQDEFQPTMALMIEHAGPQHGTNAGEQAMPDAGGTP